MLGLVCSFWKVCGRNSCSRYCGFVDSCHYTIQVDGSCRCSLSAVLVLLCERYFAVGSFLALVVLVEHDEGIVCCVVGTTCCGSCESFVGSKWVGNVCVVGEEVDVILVCCVNRVHADLDRLCDAFSCLRRCCLPIRLGDGLGEDKSRTLVDVDSTRVDGAFLGSTVLRLVLFCGLCSSCPCSISRAFHLQCHVETVYRLLLACR